ncbi:hypothetical protein ACIBEJ_02855 [Nonomuraea sp. NPDC050790]|uniref:hypothetical protein n=1 Tax=Nonomuraea sp. NPDC050790 TaxID=3364371 RepID=UPI0037A83F28
MSTSRWRTPCWDRNIDVARPTRPPPTWQVSRARVAELNPRAEVLLRLLSCYAPDHLPVDVLAGAGDDELAVNEALALLASYSLITLTTPTAGPAITGAGQVPDGRESVSIHRLTQVVIWHQLSARQREQTRARAAELLDWALPVDPRARANWPRYARLLPHARAVTPPGSDTMGKVIDAGRLRPRFLR